MPYQVALLVWNRDFEFPLSKYACIWKEKKITLKLQSQFWYLIEFVPQKDHLLSMFLKSKRNNYLGRFRKFYWLEMCYIIRSILLFSLRHLSWDICPSFPDVSFVWWSSHSFHPPRRTKLKPCLKPNFGEFSYCQIIPLLRHVLWQQKKHYLLLIKTIIFFILDQMKDIC